MGWHEMSWEYTLTLPMPGFSDWILIPAEVLKITVMLTANGKANLHITTAAHDFIKEHESEVEQVEVKAVDLSSKESDFIELPLCSAFRLECITGTCKITVRAR